jgi:hypothetical protein
MSSVALAVSDTGPSGSRAAFINSERRRDITPFIAGAVDPVVPSRNQTVAVAPHEYEFAVMLISWYQCGPGGAPARPAIAPFGSPLPYDALWQRFANRGPKRRTCIQLPSAMGRAMFVQCYHDDSLSFVEP